MKKLTLILSIFLPLICSSLAAQGQISVDQQIINEKEIRLTFTTEYELEDLEDVKNKLEKLNIEINYTSLKFDTEGKLSQISASIQYPDGVKGSFESRELKPTDGPGFRRKLKGRN